MTRKHNTLSDKLDRATFGIRSPAIVKTAFEIRGLIESARSHVAVSANLTLVNLYWNVGRIVTQDIQKDEKRAEYGEKLVEQLGVILSRDYGNGFSGRNLWDMKRFFIEFKILQTVSAELPGDGKRQMMSAELQVEPILQTVSVESSGRIIIDFRKHFRRG